MRRIVPALLLALAAALLAGCVTVEQDLMVNDDGSGSQRVRVVAPAELLSSLGSQAPDPAELRAQFEADPHIQAVRDALTGQGGSLELLTTADDGLGVELLVAVPASDDFSGALLSAQQSLVMTLLASLPEEHRAEVEAHLDELPLDALLASRLTLQRTGDEWVFEDASAGLAPELIDRFAAEEPQAATFARMLLGQVTLTTRVKLPGTVIEHNADDVLSDGTLVWTLSGDEVDRVLTARSQASSAGGSDVPVVAGLGTGALVLATVGGLAVVRRRPIATAAIE